jgi:hypothetical protein
MGFRSFAALTCAEPLFLDFLIFTLECVFLVGMESQIDQLMSQIRAAAARLVATNADLAGITGLHKNTIARLFDPDWKPRPETIAQLERILRHTPTTSSDPAPRKRRGGRPRRTVLAPKPETAATQRK